MQGLSVRGHAVSADDTGGKTVRVLAFRLPGKKQTHLDDLLEKNREGTLIDEESSDRMLRPSY